MSKSILVGCKLPCGIQLDGPSGPIVINGVNTAMIHGGFGLTHVDANDWAYLLGTYAAHAAFKSQAIFTTGNDNVADIAAKGAELSDERTGFEGLDPTKPGKGLEPEDKKKLQESLNETANKAGTKAGKVAPADRAAALALATAKG